MDDLQDSLQGKDDIIPRAGCASMGRESPPVKVTDIIDSDIDEDDLDNNQLTCRTNITLLNYYDSDGSCSNRCQVTTNATTATTAAAAGEPNNNSHRDFKSLRRTPVASPLANGDVKRPASQLSSYRIVRPYEEKHIIEKKPRKRITKTFNSFDYFLPENEEFLREQSLANPRTARSLALVRWGMSFLVGVYVAVIAVSVTICNKYLTRAKLFAVYALLHDCTSVWCLIAPTVVWMAINMALVALGAYLVTFHAPLAAGSGIPNVKCYLNGIRMPGLMSLRTLLAKAGGVVLSVSGGLACGKEGPMIHSGAICASGLAQAEFRCGSRKWRPKLCERLRTDEERRDFVAAGAASGVSAAFGSPIGGVLFSLEEGASFLRQMLTWRMLFSSMTACLVLNVILSAILGQPGNMSHPGLVSFGIVGDTTFKALEIVIFALMGVIGGLFGAAFVQLNNKITLFRRRHVRRPWLKVGEAVLVAGVSAVIFMSLIYVVPDCHPIRGFNATTAATAQLSINASSTSSVTSQMHDNIRHHVDRRSVDVDDENVGDIADHHGVKNDSDGHGPYGFHGAHGFMFQGFCPYGQHNRMADVLFKTGEGGLHTMLHAPLDEWNLLPLIILVIVYHLLATWTYGLSVSSGVFIPSLLIGSIWGRIVGIIVMTFWEGAGNNIAKYALVGAAANLGGATRMTLSLTVIVIECTGDITFGVPIMISLIIAKWVGDFFTPGIYDLHIEIQGIPLLPWDPPEMSYSLMASGVMTSPVQCLKTTEKLAELRQIAQNPSSHNGYPVVEDMDDEYSSSCDDKDLDKKEKVSGRLKGFMLKTHLMRILENFQKLDENEVIDLTPFMNISPYSIQENITLPRIFKIFRGLGLRHLVVVNDRNGVVGMITRINLARYRSETHKGFVKLEQLVVANS
jgi:H+/Cl- antiporter ClcA/CBS domain-containing protein